MDLFINTQNWLQDMGQQFDNLTLDIDGSVLDPEDFSCQWAAIYKEEGQWARQILNSEPMYHLNIESCAHLLRNGEFIMELTQRHNGTGKTWMARKPTFLFHALVGGEYENYMPFPGSLTAAQYRQQMDLFSWQAPRIPGMHFVGNRPGDINGDGVINVQDLLLFLSTFGPS